MELRQINPPYNKEFPEGYKFSWIVFNLATEKEIFFKWISLEETEKLFFKMVYEKFGYFEID